nr:immunoglobulin light chain junction region [Macaca mulatta]
DYYCIIWHNNAYWLF